MGNCLGFWLLSGLAVAAPPLPLVDQTDFAALRANVAAVTKALADAGRPLPLMATQELEQLFAAKDDAATLHRLQHILDAHCLVGVHINPESRVKAARGPAAAVLHAGEPADFLVKVHNEAGVKKALKVHSPQARSAGHGADHWLDVELVTAAPLRDRLSGRPLEYHLVRLLTTEAGKREARLAFDVGQGTQDLGFRAEVPVLFTIDRPGPAKR
jgi:hypothetical protein